MPNPNGMQNYPGMQKQINDVIGLFVKADSVLENDIIKLQQSREAHSRSHNDIFDRVEKLEKLDDEFALLQGQINAMRILGDDKKPHKCPVCNGEGRVKCDPPLKKDNATYFSLSCVPCQEKGVVWG